MKTLLFFVFAFVLHVIDAISIKPITLKVNYVYPSYDITNDLKDTAEHFNYLSRAKRVINSQSELIETMKGIVNENSNQINKLMALAGSDANYAKNK